MSYLCPPAAPPAGTRRRRASFPTSPHQLLFLLLIIQKEDDNFTIVSLFFLSLSRKPESLFNLLTSAFLTHTAMLSLLHLHRRLFSRLFLSFPPNHPLSSSFFSSFSSSRGGGGGKNLHNSLSHLLSSFFSIESWASKSEPR